MDLREVREFFKDAIGYIILIVVVLLIFIFIFSFQQVYGESMKPNYNDKDILILSKISYKINDIETQDVVALHDSNGNLYIKRVVGIPGDYVSAKEGKIYVNGIEIEEKYLDNIKTEDFELNYLYDKELKDGVLSENKYFVLGDNRSESYDSRFSNFGLIDKKQIIGKVVFKIWPIKEFGFTN